MNNFAGDTLFFGVVISLIGYEIGALLKRKLKLALFNPLLISIIFVIAVWIILEKSKTHIFCDSNMGCLIFYWISLKGGRWS